MIKSFIQLLVTSEFEDCSLVLSSVLLDHRTHIYSTDGGRDTCVRDIPSAERGIFPEIATLRSAPTLNRANKKAKPTAVK